MYRYPAIEYLILRFSDIVCFSFVSNLIHNLGPYFIHWRPPCAMATIYIARIFFLSIYVIALSTYRLFSFFDWKSGNNTMNDTLRCVGLVCRYNKHAHTHVHFIKIIIARWYLVYLHIRTQYTCIMIGSIVDGYLRLIWTRVLKIVYKRSWLAVLFVYQMCVASAA